MKKIDAILAKQAIKRSKHKPSRILAEYYAQTAKESQNFTLKIKNDLDFFNAAIMIQSLQNKQRFESTYERERKELTDLWPTLSYQERNKLINLKIAETKKRSRSFVSASGATIWIAFFDELINALYDHEMNIFDLPQYFSLYKDYKKRIIPQTTYGLAPYCDAFIDITLLRKDEHRAVFYYEPLKTLYLLTNVDQKQVLQKIGFKTDYAFVNEDKERMIKVMDHYEAKDPAGVIDELVTSPFVSEETVKRLMKVRKKLK